MARIFGGSLRLALKQSLAETGHLAIKNPSKPNQSRSKKQFTKRRKKNSSSLCSSSFDGNESECSSTCSSPRAPSSCSTDERELGDDLDVSLSLLRNPPEMRKNHTLPGKKRKRGRIKGSTSKKSLSKIRTVPTPTLKLMSWIRNMPHNSQRRHVTSGLRVKVRFDMGKKENHESNSCYRWYGGRISDVLKAGKRIRIVYDDGTKEVSPFPDKDIVIDMEGNGVHQAVGDAFLPPHLNVEQSLSDASLSSNDKFKADSVCNNGVELTQRENHLSSIDMTCSKSLSEINPIRMSSPPSNKASTVTESSFSLPSSSSIGQNDSCESSSSDSSNEYQFSTGKMQEVTPVYSTPRITLTKHHSLQHKHRNESKEYVKEKQSSSSLKIKLIPPKKRSTPKSTHVVQVKPELDQECSSCSCDEHCNCVITPLKIPLQEKIMSSKKRKRKHWRRGSNIESRSDESTSCTSLSQNKNSSQKDILSFNNNYKESEIIDSGNKNVFRFNESFSEKNSAKLLGSDSVISKLKNLESITNDSSSDLDESNNLRKPSGTLSNNILKKSNLALSHNSYDDSISKKSFPSGNFCSFENVDSLGSGSSHTYSSSNEDESHVSKVLDDDEQSNKLKNGLTSSRSSRRAAQKANERIAAKEIVLHDEYTTPKRRREKLEIKLFPLSDSSEQKPAMTFKESNRDSQDDGKEPWVQCDRCLKWRLLPSSVKMENLPERWFCELNVYDSKRNTCDAPEQTSEEISATKSFSKNRKLALDINSKSRTLRIGSKAISSKSSLSEQNISRSSSPGAFSIKLPSNATIGTSICSDSSVGHDYQNNSNQKFCLTSTDKDLINFNKQCDDSSENELNFNLSDFSSKIPDTVSSIDQEKKDKIFSPHKTKQLAKEFDKLHSTSKISEKESDKVRGKRGKKKTVTKQEWVQCEKCKKWRVLPPRISAKDLPEIWYCTMNTWDSSTASCDAKEEKVDQNVREYSLANGGVMSGSTNKLSFRNLIFGTFKKQYRPTSERARAADSLFAFYERNETSGCLVPKSMYASSSAFRPKSQNQSTSERNYFLPSLANSRLWDELNGSNNAPPLIHPQNFCEGSILNLKFRRKTFQSLNKHASSLKEIILDIISSNALAVHEIVFECQRNFSNTEFNFESIVRELHFLHHEGDIETFENKTRPSNSYIMPSCTDSFINSMPTSGRQNTIHRSTRSLKILKPWKKSDSKTS